MNKDNLINLLGYGKESAKTTKQLASTLGITDRAVTRTIQHLRIDGQVILSSNSGKHKGFFLFDGDVRELQHFINSMNSRQRHIRASAIPAMELLKQINAINNNQLNLDEFDIDI